jgi:predicted Zn-dependent peptidase
MVQITKLDNGLRVLTVPMPYLQSVSVGFFMQVGSRCESELLSGASHFIEHMLFKGTASRPSAQEVADAIEGKGGMFNANTGLETTLFWAKVAAPDLREALDVLSDMLLRSVFDPAELEKERAVIVEEIKYDLDTPDSLVEMLVTQLQWPDHPLGRDVAGSPDNVAKLSREALIQYHRTHYLPGETVLSLAGQVDHAEAMALASLYLSEWQPGPTPSCQPAPPNGHGPRLRVEHREIEQAHVNFSFDGLARTHPDRFVLNLMNVILGEGMHSRLFQELRERQGLAYSVDSYVNLLRDTGSIGIYAGVAPESVDRAIQAILAELDRLRQDQVPTDELQKAKRFARGRLALALEDPFAMASWYARQELLGPQILEPNAVAARLEETEAHDIQRLAQALFQESGLNLALVGPLGGEEKFRRSARL